MLKQNGMGRVKDDITTLKLCKEMQSFRLYPVLEDTEPAKHNGLYTLVINSEGQTMRITHEEFAIYFDLWKSLAANDPVVTKKKRGRPKKVKR